MNAPKAINGRDIFWIGVNDRDTELFEGLWPLPRGVSYNAYLIADTQTVLMDTVKNKSALEFLDKVRQVIGNRPLDYLVVNHMEPDHSGAMKLILELYPRLQVVGNAKTARFMADFYGITERIKVVADGETLDTGRHTLQFHLTPMVHWPETMVTYDQTDRILFSMDAFGGFGALDGGLFDDEVDIGYYEDEALRYFSNIVGKYSAMTRQAIHKLAGLELAVVAPTHGPVWRRDPARIVALYDRWSRHEAEAGVVIAYGSMYGNTERMVDAVAQGILEAGLARVRIHNVGRSHLSQVIRDAWRFSTVALAGPTYDQELFPPMEQLIRLLAAKKLTNRTLGVFGTYAWSGGAVKRLRAFADETGWPLAGPVIEAKGGPTAADLEQCRELGRELAARAGRLQPPAP